MSERLEAMREALERFVLGHSTAGTSTIHGLRHWRRVERNGRLLAVREGCEPDLVVLFAYTHDFLRENDGHDPGHGPRAADFVMHRWRETGVEVPAERLRELATACRDHTSSNSPPSRLVALCWDADRLDLPRVGIEPELEYFHTDAARTMVRNGEYSRR